VLVASLAFALAWWLVPPPLAVIRQVRTRPQPAPRPLERPMLRNVVCPLGCGLAAMTIGGVAWLFLGAVAGLVLASYLGRLEPASEVRRRERLGRDLPLAADLLAACARAGQPLGRSLAVVGDAVGGPLSDRLAAIDARLRFGSDPVTEWRAVSLDPQLGALGRVVLRSLESGAPLVDGLERLALDRRREQRMLSQQRARSVGVKAAAPLAGCFLPAFMLIGVVPTVVGGFANLVL
jgi:Flp pilus assembly protein TadB